MTAKKQQKPAVDISQLIELLYNRTVEWGKKYDLYPKGVKAPKEPCSEKAKKLAHLLDNHSFGGHDDAVREGYEILLGEKIPVSKNKKNSVIEFLPLTILVILSDPKGKNLPVGEPVLVRETTGVIITKDHKTLSIDANTSTSSFRLPTLTEVEDMLGSIKEAEDITILVMIAFLLGKK